MCDDSEEDVVFEGSPLYQHLHHTGYTDFEAQEVTTAPHHRDPPPTPQVAEWSLWDGVMAIVSSLTGTSQCKESLRLDLTKTLVDTRLVNYSDQLLLDHFLPEESSECPAVCWPGSIGGRGVALAVSCVPVGVLISTGAYLCKSPTVLIGSLVALTAPLLCAVLYDLKLYREFCRRIGHLKKMTKSLQDVGQLSSKSLRLLVEVDLISRGFVLAQGSSSFHLSSGVESPSCLSLRRTLSSCLGVWGRGVGMMHDSLVPHTARYPTLTGLFQTPVDLAGNDVSAKEHLKLLKESTNLIKLQTSTVLTELILVTSNLTLLENYLHKEHRLLDNQESLADTAEELSRHLEYTRTYWLQHRDEPPSEKRKSGVYMAIHSLSLHMQAFLYKVQDLENKFQVEDDEALSLGELNKDELLDLPPYEDVRQQLQTVRAGLDSCVGCWEEAVQRLDQRYCIEEETPREDPVTISTLPPQEPMTLETKRAPIVLSEMDVPVAQDEVFEAYIEEEYSARRNSFGYDCDDEWTADARKRRKEMKRQKQQGKLVLHELQPILSQRREMWEQREIAALRRQQGADQSPQPEEKVKEERIENEEQPDEMGEVNTALLDVSLSVTAPSCGNYHEVDSDEERLKKYKRLKEELNNENEVDSDEERLKRYRKVKQEMSGNEDEYDSDEERLKRYRKVRQEMNDDENTRDYTSERVIPQFNPFLGGKPLTFDKLQRNNENQLISEDDSKNDKVSCVELTENQLECDSRSTTRNHEWNNGPEEINKTNQSTPQSRYNESVVQKDTVAEFTTGGQQNIDQSPLNHDENLNGDILKDETGGKKTGDETEGMETGEETFTHNEDITEHKDATEIDWSSAQFNSRELDTFEDRLSFLSGGVNLSLHAGVAAEAHALALKFRRAQPAETFGGVGESEEVFGETSDSEDSD